jgi:hypothetical protein
MTKRLGIGSIAWLSHDGGVLCHLRTLPHPAFGKDIGQIFTGEKLIILDGPEPGEGFVWWRVRASDGREGWLPEVELLADTSDTDAERPPRTQQRKWNWIRKRER